jgi:hypothetical protein
MGKLSFNDILHDIIAAGLVSAALFVKNPESQQRAAVIINAVNPLIELLEAQIAAAQAKVDPAPPPDPTPVYKSAGLGTTIR